MYNSSNTLNKLSLLELTRHENFVDGRVDMFDLLAASGLSESNTKRSATPLTAKDKSELA